MRICKTFTFDAAHRLDLLPPDHKCHHLHGHTYRVDIIVTGGVDASVGWVVDYADVAKAWQPLFDKLDHKYLNDVGGLSIPTTETLAVWIYDQLHTPLMGHNFRLHSVRVYESSTTYCEYP